MLKTLHVGKPQQRFLLLLEGLEGFRQIGAQLKVSVHPRSLTGVFRRVPTLLSVQPTPMIDEQTAGNPIQVGLPLGCLKVGGDSLQKP